LLDSPSLKTKMPVLIKQAYKAAREEAAAETKLPLKTFPEELPEEFLKVLPRNPKDKN
jgi:5'-deoxynucleotidase YfbR-like HD superfamily hydrolase